MLLLVRFVHFEIRDHDFTAGQNLFGSFQVVLHLWLVYLVPTENRHTSLRIRPIMASFSSISGQIFGDCVLVRARMF